MIGGIEGPRLTTHRDRLYIGGTWVEPAVAGTIDVDDAWSNEPLGSVPLATAADVDAAVEAARRAFPAWSAWSIAERLELLLSLRDVLLPVADDLAELITSEVGTPIRLSKLLQARAAIAVIEQVAEVLPGLSLEERVGASLVVQEPIGVVACITAWNYPLQQVLGKVIGALATGCTVILKPSELAPLSAFVVADAIDQVGFPPGVFNLVSGTGASAGEALVSHAGVDTIHFTGSTRAGRAIGAAAAATVKRVALELGGKSANIILDDADVARAVKIGVANAYTNGGQTCTAWTRMLVPRSRLDEVERLVTERIANYRMGDPHDEDTNLGPMASGAQRDSIHRHILRGIEQGARLVAGGLTPPDATDHHFVAPTVFSDVTFDMDLAQEEIFGPVLSILPYDTEDEAVQIANSTIYGLAGGVWSADPDRALAVARRLRSGQVDINGSFFNPLAPFGGYKQSGVGRELGARGLLEFYETKALQFG